MVAAQFRDQAVSAARQLGRPIAPIDFFTSANSSIVAFLDGQRVALRRLTSWRTILPEELYVCLNDWKQSLTEHELLGIIRRRGQQWTDAVCEMLSRLENDWSNVVSGFGLKADARLVGISEPLSDIHNNGRSVYRLTFDDGQSVVYKPRFVDGEVVFARLLRWIAHSGYEPTLSFCRVVPRWGYGWTEYIAPQPCNTADQALLFYRRQGAFAAVFYLLRGSDCLRDNVVGRRENPVWVDTECLCTPQLGLSGPPKSHNIPEWISHSILATLFVFHANRRHIPPRRFTGLSFSCRVDRLDVFTKDDVLRDPYIEAVLAGFSSMYIWLLSRKATLLAKNGPLSWLSDRHVRVVPRPTSLYAALVESMFTQRPRAMLDIECKVKCLLRDQVSSYAWGDALIDGELAAIRRGDIPSWSTSTRSAHLFEASGAVVPYAIERNGLECLYERGEQLEDRDLKNQLWIIESHLRLPNRSWAES